MRIYILIAFTICLAGTSQAQLFDKQEVFTRKDSLRGMLTPDRTCYDVTFYDLEVKVDIDQKFISGSNKIYFTALQDFNRLQIDLFDNLKITRISYNGSNLEFTREYNAVFVYFPKTKKGTTGYFTVEYEGNPQIAKNAPWDGGFSWAKDQNGNNWVGVSCQGLGASVWWPNKDHLSDEPDSMMIRLDVPNELMGVANGNLRSEVAIEPGFRQYNWFVSYPINNYDVSANIGKYTHFSDEYVQSDGYHLPLDYYVLDYNLDKAKKQFQQVKPMLKCYDQYFGPYPFEKDGYALVETPYVGMEHQSAVAYGNGYKDGYFGFDYSGIGLDFDYIIIHESGHEWWGNNVSMKDLADMWIHEGFCTYGESVYVECMYGHDKAIQYLNAMKKRISNDAAIIGNYDVNNEGSGDMYDKSALMLNTLRTLTGNDDLWWSIIKGIQKDFAKQTVSTQQIENYVSRKAGKDFSREFDQYLREKDLPLLEYVLTKSDKGLVVKYHWKSNVAGFDMPLRYLSPKGEWVWFNPTTDWQEMTIEGLDPAQFKLDEMHFYFASRVLKNQN